MSALTSSAPASRWSGPLVGISLMLTGIFLYSVNDTIGKWLVGTYSVGIVLLVRSLSAIMLLVPFVRRDGGFAVLFNPPRPRLQLFRVVLTTIEVACFYSAVRFLPLADVMTFYLAGPIYVAALSVIILKEKIDAARWAAIIVGFVGVVIVLQPSPASLSPPALISIAGSLMFAVLMIITRQLRGTADSSLLAFSTSGAFVAGAASAPFGWITPSPIDAMLLLLLGVIALLAGFCVNRSLRLAPASVVVPYQYTMLLWALVFGYAVFGDKPKPAVLVGAAIIVASGLFIFIREQRAGQRGAGDSVAEEVGANAPTQP